MFIWVSPRNYVEYYLPLNASAAMLAACAVYRCRQDGRATLALMGTLVLVEALLLWLAPPDGRFPWLHFWPAGPQGFTGYFLAGLIPLALGAVLWWLLRAPSSRPRRGLVLLIIAAVMPLMLAWRDPPRHGSLNLLAAPLHNFAEKLDELKLQQKYIQETGGPATDWENVADYIRTHSQSADGLYVWGWYPGIYVRAQRFSPTFLPCYSTMHSDSPRELTGVIKRMTEELRKNPPKFIVDTQKVDFPYYDHPVFDLWPRWGDSHKNGFDFRNNLMLSENKNAVPMSLDEAKKLEENYLGQVKDFCILLMTNKNRPGGALAAPEAEKLANLEVARHRAMAPLRQFVLEHYQPAGSLGGMFILQLQAPRS